MSKQLKVISFFTAALFAFGISALDFDNLAILENKRAYIALISGILLAIIYARSKRRENQKN